MMPYFGIVEDVNDPRELGRARVRIFGIHTYDKVLIPTEGLPWAVVVQPTTSAANSGIGITPKLLPGTLVMIVFTDPDEMQSPIIVGTIPSELKEHIISVDGRDIKRGTTGIGFQDPKGSLPLKSYVGFNDLPKLARNYNVTTQTVVSSTDADAATQTTEETVKPASNLVQTFKASELTVSNEMVEELKKSEGFRSKPYDDGTGVWTIGYGSTFLADGSRVTKNTPEITKAQATELLKLKLAKEFEPAVRKFVKAEVTQSMYDALVDLTYNCGAGGCNAFSIESGLNNGRYQQSADFFNNFRVLPGTKVEKGLRRRRQHEKEWFLKDGIPGEDKPSTTKQPTEAFSQSSQTTTVTEETTETKAEFPRQSMKFSNSLFELTEPGDIRDKHRYPHNQVRQSQKGHYEEWDDTPGNERINLQHSSGSFEEWRPDGSRVVKVYKKNFTLIASDDHVYIGGNVNVHISGNSNLYIQGNQKTHIAGDHFIQVDGNLTELVGGSKTVQVNGNYRNKSGGDTSFDTGGYFDMNSNVFGNDIVSLKAVQSVAMPEPNRIELSDAQWAAIQDSAQKSNQDPPELKGVGEVPQEGDASTVSDVEETDDIYITLCRNLDKTLVEAKAGSWKETGSNSKILDSYKACGFNIASDQVPWCAAYAGAIMKASGIKSLKTLSSLAYKGFGKSVDIKKPETWRLNDIIIFSRKGGGHIGFFRGYNKNTGAIFVLGGNQSDNVTEAGFQTGTGQMEVVYVGRAWDIPTEYDRTVYYTGSGSTVKVV